MLKRALILAGLAGMALPAQAHDLWLAAASSRVEILYGHPGDVSRPDKARLFELTALAEGTTISLLDQVKLGDTALSAPLPKAATVVAARYDNGFWVQTAQGYRNTNRRNLPDALKSMWSQKFTKLLLPGDGVTQAVGHRLELVPLADPFHLKTGEALRLRVEYGGKPLPGATVEIGDGKTEADPPKTVAADTNGVVTIPPAPGQIFFSVGHKVPGSFPDLGAEDVLAATLSLGPAP